MTWRSELLFQANKAIFGDRFLASYSIEEKELLNLLDGKTVAVVGNSRALAEQPFGALIDGNDIVIRLNDAPIMSHDSHGSRTDWIGVAKRLSAETLAARKPELLLWMTRKRKRLTKSMATYSKFYLNPESRYEALREALGARPSVGFMVIDLVRRSSARHINLFGFDFFDSQSLSGRRTKDQVPHDFAAERRSVEAMLNEDPRFSLH